MHRYLNPLCVAVATRLTDDVSDDVSDASVRVAGGWCAATARALIGQLVAARATPTVAASVAERRTEAATCREEAFPWRH